MLRRLLRVLCRLLLEQSPEACRYEDNPSQAFMLEWYGISDWIMATEMVLEGRSWCLLARVLCQG